MLILVFFGQVISEEYSYVTIPIQSGLLNKKWIYWDCPLMDPHLLLAYLWDSVQLTIDSGTLHEYWQGAKDRGLPWALSYQDGQPPRIPLRIFGDDAAVGRKSGEKLYAIFLSCPLFRPKCARQSRWLLWCLRSSLYVGRVGRV